MYSGRLPYDEKSKAIIRLNNGMMLYLKEVNASLALVCLMRADAFMKKQALMVHNFDRFKQAVGQVFAVKKPVSQ